MSAVQAVAMEGITENIDNDEKQLYNSKNKKGVILCLK